MITSATSFSLNIARIPWMSYKVLARLFEGGPSAVAVWRSCRDTGVVVEDGFVHVPPGGLLQINHCRAAPTGTLSNIH